MGEQNLEKHWGATLLCNQLWGAGETLGHNLGEKNVIILKATRTKL